MTGKKTFKTLQGLYEPTFSWGQHTETRGFAYAASNVCHSNISELVVRVRESSSAFPCFRTLLVVLLYCHHCSLSLLFYTCIQSVNRLHWIAIKLLIKKQLKPCFRLSSTNLYLHFNCAVIASVLYLCNLYIILYNILLRNLTSPYV